MAKPKCFCGCGVEVGRFPLFSRSANNIGRDITERLEYTRAMLGDQMQLPSFAPWNAHGELHLEALRNAIHNHTGVDQDEILRWMRAGRDLERGFTDMGGPSILFWLSMSEEMRTLPEYHSIVGRIRELIAETAPAPATDGGD